MMEKLTGEGGGNNNFNHKHAKLTSNQTNVQVVNCTCPVVKLSFLN